MAKKVKSRKGKKRNPLKVLQSALDKVVMYSAHCYVDMQVIGVDHPAIKYAIFNQQHNWQIMLMVFCRDGDKTWQLTEFPDIKQCKAKALQDECDKRTAKIIESVNPKYFISSGWYVVMNNKVDLFSAKDQILDMFINDGADNRHICNLAWNQRPDNEK